MTINFTDLIKRNSASLYLDEVIYLSLLRESFKQNNIILNQLKEGIDGKDLVLIKSAVHGLKGAFLNLRISALADLFIEIEELANSMVLNYDQMNNVFNKCEQTYAELNDVFEKIEL